MSEHLELEVGAPLGRVRNLERLGSRRPILSLVWVLSPETAKPLGRCVVTDPEARVCLRPRHDTCGQTDPSLDKAGLLHCANHSTFNLERVD
jgi:phosphoribosyl-dephospho-CoA transferase